MAILCALVNRKGGVGKTSCVFHLAGYFAAALGKRVLLIDNDPQHSLTAALLGIDQANALPPEETIAAIFDATPEPRPQDLIRQTGIDGLHLVPGSDSLRDPEFPRPFNETCRDLRSFVDEASINYDIVLFDNPPDVGVETVSALAAADFALCPLNCDDYGAHGAVTTLATVGRIQRTRNSDLRLCGFLPNKFKPRLAIQKLYEERLRAAHGSDVFAAMLPDLADFEVATASRQPVSVFKPKCPAAKAIAKVAAEILERVSNPGAIREAA